MTENPSSASRTASEPVPAADVDYAMSLDLVRDRHIGVEVAPVVADVIVVSGALASRYSVRGADSGEKLPAMSRERAV